VFATIETLLFDGCNESAISYQSGGGVSVISIDTQNKHLQLRSG
jgi:hypothetical protein